MPVYNDEEFLEESINTVINQTLDDIELVCIDDGSTDNSLDMLINLKHKYNFIKVYSQYNQGSGKARNNGINKAKGDYIAFLDSDDKFIDNDALEKMYSLAIKNNADMVSANLKGITVKNELVNNDDGVERFTSENIITSSEYGIPYAFYKNIFKRDFLNRHNIRFPDLKRGQDPVFLSEILSKIDKIPVIPIDLYGFRYAPTGGLSKINTFEKKWDYIKHFRETFHILKQANFNEILEEYKKKLFLYINHAKNSSDEVIYNIVQEIFEDDYEVLSECNKYFNIINVDESLDDNFSDGIKVSKDKIRLKSEINKLNTEIYNLNRDKQVLYVKNSKLGDNDKIVNQLKLDCYRLQDENRYLFESNYKLRKKIIQLYDIYGASAQNNSFIKLLMDKSIFFTEEYCALIDKQHEYDMLFTEIFNNQLSALNFKKHILDNNINSINNNLSVDYFSSLKLKLKKLNIAYVLYGFPTLSETFIINELRWLRHNGFNVKVFTFGNPYKPVNLDFDLDIIKFDFNDNLVENLEKLVIKHDIDLMHTHFVYPTGTKYTYPVAKKLKIPFTLFAHAFDIFIKEHDKINNISEISNSEFCRGIFTLSEYHKNYLIQRNVPQDKIIITRQATEYNIVPLSYKNNGINNIVSISRFVEKKGLDVLIDVANILKDYDFEFSIYGFGPLEEELQNQIDELNLDNISIKGILDNPFEVRNTLMASDLLVSPCKIAKNGDRDGIPTVIFESMGYGVPVLTTDVSAIPEVINDNKNGFIVESENPKIFADKIIEINNLPSKKLFEVRRRAQLDVQEFSSIEKTMHNLLKVWSIILNDD